MERCCCDIPDTSLVASVEESAFRVLASAQADGAATFFEMSTLAISHGPNFVKYAGNWTRSERDAILRISDMMAHTISDSSFASTTCDFSEPRPCLSSSSKSPSLYLTTPLFLSMLTGAEGGPAYFLEHVDRQTYNNSHMRYSATLYLREHGVDFEGGRLWFDDHLQQTVRPRRGLAVMFSSGEENPHHVERVSAGVRIALTMFYSDDVDHKYRDQFTTTCI